MSQFAFPIPDELRSQITLPPPPMWDNRTSALIPYGDVESVRYSDLALAKKTNVVYIDEELDLFSHPASTNHYRMMIRHMPWKSDLELILLAAKHMLLIGEYSCEYSHREGLLPTMECGFWDIQYAIPMEHITTDVDSLANVRVVIPYWQRKRIWTELFEAMGHRTKWGNSVLNVRRRK